MHDPRLFLFAGGFFIFALGLADDLRPLPPYVKLVGQIAVACLMIMAGVHINLTGNPFVYIPLTILWFVGITNAFNLLDNMDGLAGGIAFVAAITLVFVTSHSPSLLPTGLTAVFAAAVLGFLIFNVNPAKIFMGDCGSQWLGFTLAGFTILDTWASASNLFLMIATPVLVLAVPIFDTALVALNRKLHGRAVSHGGKDHSSHRLVALGLSVRKTVAILWGLSALFGLMALLAHNYQLETWGVIVGFGMVFTMIFGFFLTDVKVYEQAPPARSVETRLGAIRLLYKRRIAEIALDFVLIGGAYVLAYLVRFDWQIDEYQLTRLIKTLPLVLAVKLIAFLASGLYRGIWAYIDFEGFARLLKSSLWASVTTVFMILALNRFVGFSRSLFFIDFAILLLLMGGVRALLRGLRESVFAFPEYGLRVLVIGAGDAARFLLHEIRKNRQWNLRPVGLVDDDPRKHGTEILGIPVVGRAMEIRDLVVTHKVGQVIIAIPSLEPDRRMEIEQLCRDADTPVVSMQSLEDSIIRKLG
jgi:UDP-GlcNAc:undecaprenyl-phosphate GlcNAc-1-phosphate transferase